MEIKINTIEEYHQAIVKGWTTITFGNDEIFEYVRKDIEQKNKVGLAQKQKFVEYQGNLVYNLDSKFNFGKHKNNELRYVFKCDPYYVEWCMLNASGFIISIGAINILVNETVFNVEDLFKFAKPIDENQLELNLTSFQVNHKLLPYSDEVKEEIFFFTKEAIQGNLDKSKNRMDTSDLFKGGNWGRKSIIQDRRLSKKSIIIKY